MRRSPPNSRFQTASPRMARTAAAVNAGARPSVRRAYFRSCRTVSMAAAAAKNMPSPQERTGRKGGRSRDRPSRNRDARSGAVREEPMDVAGDDALLVGSDHVDREAAEMLETGADAIADLRR